MSKEKAQNGLNISISNEIAQGVYSNVAITSHSASEFVIDFASMLPALEKAEVRSRIIMTPENAKNLLLSLQDNIAKYEANVRAIGSNANTALQNMDISNVVS